MSVFVTSRGNVVMETQEGLVRVKRGWIFLGKRRLDVEAMGDLIQVFKEKWCDCGCAALFKIKWKRGLCAVVSGSRVHTPLSCTFLTHHTTQQVNLPGPWNLKLNWARTLRFCFWAQSPPPYVTASLTLHPLFLVQTLAIPHTELLSLLEFLLFFSNEKLDTPPYDFFCALHDMHLLDNQGPAPRWIYWQTGLSARWESMIDCQFEWLVMMRMRVPITVQMAIIWF